MGQALEGAKWSYATEQFQIPSEFVENKMLHDWESLIHHFFL